MHALGTSSADSNALVCILCALSSFESLFATARASKAFYAVYKTNEVVIIKSVAHNYVGPALSLALQVVHHDDRARAEDSMTEDSDDEGQINLQLVRKQARTLVKNANMVNEWEALFSLLRKNRRFRTSQLTSLESWRFQRAIYRALLYSRLFPSDKSAYSNIDDTDPVPAVTQELSARKAFLSDCFTNELSQLYAVANFMTDILRWVDAVDGLDMQGMTPDFVAIAHSTGPAVILECYKSLGFEPLTEEINKLCPETTPDYFEDIRRRPLFSGYLVNSIAEIVSSRDPEYDLRQPDIILETENLVQEACSQCNSKFYPMALWGENTWDYLSLPSTTLGTYLFPAAASFMKGQLSQNPVESKYIEALLIKTPLKEIYEDIFSKGIKLPSYSDRTNDYWICYACITSLVKDHLHLWVNMKRKEAKEKVPDDCWYGYNCRTQTKLHHAQKLNHLCEPKR